MAGNAQIRISGLYQSLVTEVQARRIACSRSSQSSVGIALLLLSGRVNGQRRRLERRLKVKTIRQCRIEVAPVFALARRLAERFFPG